MDGTLAQILTELYVLTAQLQATQARIKELEAHGAKDRETDEVA